MTICNDVTKTNMVQTPPQPHSTCSHKLVLLSCSVWCVLVHLEVLVDVAYEGERCEEGDRAKHEEEHVATEECVAEELHGLQGAVHMGALVVVEESIAKHKETDGPVCVCVVGRNSGKLNGLGSLERVFLFQDWCAYSGYTHYTAYSSSIPRPTVSGNGITIDYHGPIPRPKVSENRTTVVLFLDPPLVVWPKR